jgi:quinate dehydrogenase (quinone)
VEQTAETRRRGRWAHFVLAVLFAAAGLFFAVGGGMLIANGGSVYYLISGLAILVLAWGLVRNKLYVGPLYAVIFVATVAWSFWEAGADFWPLFARLFIFVVAGALLAFALPSLRRNVGAKALTGLHVAIGLVLVAGAAWMFVSTYQVRGTFNAAATTATTPVTPETEQVNWDNYGANAEGERFVALDQINRTNVDKLQVAWSYQHGDIPDSPNGVGREDLTTPLQIGNTVFLCTPKNNVVALDATSGKERWKALINSKTAGWSRCRGIAYFDGTGQQANRAQAGLAQRANYVANTDPGVCARRILTSTSDTELVAINADTGEFCSDFGTNGRINLMTGMGETNSRAYRQTSAPTLAGDVVVVGGFVNDNINADIASGVIRAFDVKTGALRWAWDSGNPAVTGAPTQDVPYSRGSPNVWSTMTYDPATDTLFLPMGSNSPDLWGGNRDENRDKYGSSVVALRGSDGRPVWHYQTVHHDLWDFDLTMQPTLTMFPKDGQKVPAVVFGTKQGMFFVIDRRTGEPLTKVEERSVPAGKLKGERYSPTQPFSAGMPQIGADPLTEADMWGMTPFDQLICRIDFKSMVPTSMFDPPTLDKQLLLPGSLGGFNWGGVSVDPTGHTMFANDLRLGLRLQMGERTSADEVLPKGTTLAMTGTPYYVKEKTRFYSPLGIPCQEPPFGTMTAIDLNTQKVAWSVPAGTVQDVEILGIKVGLGIPIGLPTIGGSMVTQGGLLFFSSTLDYYMRAYDSATGSELWKSRLPVGSQGTPISYKSPDTGEQFVLVTAGGARNSNDRGDYVIAYKLAK